MKNSILNPKNWFLDETQKKRLKVMKTLRGRELDFALIDIDYPLETHRKENLSKKAICLVLR